jgi:hypothetical protein
VKETIPHALLLFTFLGWFLGGTVSNLWADDPTTHLTFGRRIDTVQPSIVPDVPLLLPNDPADASSFTLSAFKPWNPSSVKTESEGEWGTITSNVVLTDPFGSPGSSWDDPLHRYEWKRDDAWKMDVAGPLSLFGQVGAVSSEAATTDMKLTGKTGLACKVPLGDTAEVQVRSGPSFTCTDPLGAVANNAHSQWLLEVQAKCPLIAGIGLQYDWTAQPALTAQDHDQINHDVSLAMPMGTSGKLRFGARYKWENVPGPQPLADGMQVYMGLELTR